MAASSEALHDAGWHPQRDEDLEATVSRPPGSARRRPLTRSRRACTWAPASAISTTSTTQPSCSRAAYVPGVQTPRLLTLAPGLPQGVASVRAAAPHQPGRGPCVDEVRIHGRCTPAAGRDPRRAHSARARTTLPRRRAPPAPTVSATPRASSCSAMQMSWSRGERNRASTRWPSRASRGRAASLPSGTPAHGGLRGRLIAIALVLSLARAPASSSSK